MNYFGTKISKTRQIFKTRKGKRIRFGKITSKGKKLIGSFHVVSVYLYSWNLLIQSQLYLNRSWNFLFQALACILRSIEFHHVFHNLEMILEVFLPFLRTDGPLTTQKSKKNGKQNGKQELGQNNKGWKNSKPLGPFAMSPPSQLLGPTQRAEDANDSAHAEGSRCQVVPWVPGPRKTAVMGIPKHLKVITL